MKKVLLTCLLFCLTLTAQAQDFSVVKIESQEQNYSMHFALAQSSQNIELPFTLEGTSFFSSFYEKSKNPVPWDTSKKIYFQPGLSSSKEYSDELHGYTYEDKSKKLTLWAGALFSNIDKLEERHYPHVDWSKTILIDKQRTSEKVRGTIYYTAKSYKSFEGEYDEVKYYAYGLQIVNTLPSGIMDNAKQRIVAQFTVEPTEAQRLAKAARLIFAVKPIGYDKSFYGLLFYIRPVLGNDTIARKTSVYSGIIDCELTDVIIWDSEKEVVIAEIKVNQ